MDNTNTLNQVVNRMQLNEAILPIMHFEKPTVPYYKVCLDSATVYFTNVKSEYRYDERRDVIRGWARYAKDDTSVESKAYSELIWHLFPEFLDAYKFSYADPRMMARGLNKDLYIARNSLGFIKIGIATNVEARIAALKNEVDGEFELLKTIKGGGKYECLFHSELMIYLAVVKKKYTEQVSSECFLDVPEVTEKIDYILANLEPLFKDFTRLYN